MKIIMLTNTYLPIVGGVAKSVDQFAEALRDDGHEVLIVAPEADDTTDNDTHVVRVPALQRFNGSDFSVRYPIPGLLHSTVEDFGPQIVHSHHPFLLGDAALRMALSRQLPLVFTHHTMYERYTHYVPGDSPLMKQFAVNLATEYANMAQQVIAPSQSIAEILKRRGVQTPITAIPTGVEVSRFREGDGGRFRRRYDIPEDEPVVGHVGRLAPEKNLELLADAVIRALRDREDGRFLLVGDGPSRSKIQSRFAELRLANRLITTGSLDGQDLIDAYHAMDLFGFASQTETQGMVLAEAMAAGLPVAAIDAPGVREIVDDGKNGRLIEKEQAQPLAEAMDDLLNLDDARREQYRQAALETAEQFSTRRCVRRLAEVYERLIADAPAPTEPDEQGWTRLLRRIEGEWDLWTSRAAALGEAIADRRDESLATPRDDDPSD